MFENIREDYVVYGRSLKNQAFWAICVYRYGVWAASLRCTPLRWLACKFYGLVWIPTIIVTGVKIDRMMRVGKHFHIVHPYGVSLHPATVFGDNCGVMHGVTTGTNMDRPGVPVIGNGVFIGCQSSILGPVRIGDNAHIAANSLVITDVPPNSIAVGVPAKVFPRLGAIKKPEGTLPSSVDAQSGTNK